VLADYTQNCENLPFDGVLGLALVSDWSSTGFIENLWIDGKISEPIFSLFLRDFESKESHQSVIQFGEFDLKAFSSHPEEVFFVESYTSAEEWMPLFEKVQLGPWNFNFNTSIKMTSTHNTILGDSNFYFFMLTSLKQSGIECFAMPKNSIECRITEKNDLPDLIFSIEGNSIRVGVDSIWKCLDLTCKLKIEFSRAGYWMIGEVLLQDYYTIYNFKNSSIGFAPSIGKKSRKGNSSDSSN
jgi:hypothetical protein